MGTWAPTQEEAEVVEMIADKDEEWEERLKGKSAWINKPAQPPGLLRSGALSLWCPGAISLFGYLMNEGPDVQQKETDHSPVSAQVLRLGTTRACVFGSFGARGMRTARPIASYVGRSDCAECVVCWGC